MTPRPVIKYIVYALVIVLSLIVLALVFAAPSTLTESKSVYQGF